MKCSLGISNLLEEISSLSPSIVFLCFLHWSLRKAFLSLLAIFWHSAFKRVYLSFSALLFASLLFTAICKASSDSHFAFLHFFFLGMVLVPDQLCVCISPSLSGLLQSSPHPSPLGHPRAPVGAPCAVTAGSRCLSVLHMLVYLFQASSQFILLCPSSLRPRVHSLHLHLYSCPVNKLISTIFLDSVYLYMLPWYLFFSFWLTSLSITDFRYIHIIKITQFCSFSLLGNIPLCIHTTSSLYIHFVHGHTDCEAYHIFNVCEVIYFLIIKLVWF